MGKVYDRAPNMYASGESDDLIVPRKQANNAGPMAAAEPVEERGSTKGNGIQSATYRTQRRIRVTNCLDDVRQVGRSATDRHAPEVRAV